eukprot:gene4758-6670_t
MQMINGNIDMDKNDSNNFDHEYDTRDNNSCDELLNELGVRRYDKIPMNDFQLLITGYGLSIISIVVAVVYAYASIISPMIPISGISFLDANHTVHTIESAALLSDEYNKWGIALMIKLFVYYPVDGPIQGKSFKPINCLSKKVGKSVEQLIKTLLDQIPLKYLSKYMEDVQIISLMELKWKKNIAIKRRIK